MADRKENVVIRAGDCLVTFLPQLGGKISSLSVSGNELLQAPLKPYGVRNQTMSFADGDASGWDECLPSVADCTVSTPAGEITIPDHGDLWRVPWQTLASSPDSVTMCGRCFSLPLELTRCVTVSETDHGWQLKLLYSLANVGAYAVPWSWSAHPSFAVEAGDRLHLPASVTRLRVEGSAGGRLGFNGETISWPSARLTDGSTADLTTARSRDTKIGDKLFAGPVQEGWCTLERLTLGLRLTVEFDPALTPYLGLWMCFGGWPESGDIQQMCIAMEPTTAPVDSLAITGPWSRVLQPKEFFDWWMTLNIDRIR